MKTDNKSIFGNLNVETRWYAIHTRSRHEKRVDARLHEKGIISFLPLNVVYRKWSDRYKKVEMPLFSGYVFVNICLKDRLPVLQTDGVVSLVSFNGIPAPIPDDQIGALQKVLDKQPSVSLADYYTPGTRVRVTQGPLRDIEGTLVHVKNDSRLILSIDGIQQAISLEIDPRDLEVISV